MQIREADYRDAQQIANVHVQSWRTTYRNIVPNDYLSNLSAEQRQKMWESSMNASTRENKTYVIDDQGVIVGFVNGGPSRNKDYRHEAEVYAIYLLENYQRKGLGSQLFNHIRAYFLEKGYETMMLWVLRDNSSLMFYQKQGGTIIGETTITIGGQPLIEVAVGWDSISIPEESDEYT